MCVNPICFLKKLRNALLFSTSPRKSSLMSFFADKVIGHERNPVIFLLLVDAALNFCPDNVELHYGEVIHSESYDTYFYDPMYDDHNKKAAPKKEMMIFRQLVGADEDCVNFAVKLKEFKKRLVIKRSIKAKQLLPNVHHDIRGKSTRYDVY